MSLTFLSPVLFKVRVVCVLSLPSVEFRISDFCISLSLFILLKWLNFQHGCSSCARTGPHKERMIFSDSGDFSFVQNSSKFAFLPFSSASLCFESKMVSHCSLFAFFLPRNFFISRFCHSYSSILLFSCCVFFVSFLVFLSQGIERWEAQRSVFCLWPCSRSTHCSISRWMVTRLWFRHFCGWSFCSEGLRWIER